MLKKMLHGTRGATEALQTVVGSFLKHSGDGGRAGMLALEKRHWLSGDFYTSTEIFADLRKLILKQTTFFLQSRTYVVNVSRQ